MYKVGDQVQLKVGGAVMTIVGFNAATGHPVCAWFVGDEPKRHPFALETLRLLKQSSHSDGSSS